MKRDDIIEYSQHNHHSEEEGVQKRKEIWKVTLILSVITIIEVTMGILLGKVGFLNDQATWDLIKLAYIGLTVVKAGYIIMTFMHLGEERKPLRWLILAPYMFFALYLLFFLLVEANADVKI
ncbi:MAG: cytochrome C oxidase subunit IV family protein [Salibacteraceae bacterium]